MGETMIVKILKKLPKYDEYFSGIITEKEYAKLEKGKTLEVSVEVGEYLIENKWGKEDKPEPEKPEQPEKPKENEALAKGLHVKSPISVNNKKLLPGNLLTQAEIEWLGKETIKYLLGKGLLIQVK